MDEFVQQLMALRESIFKVYVEAMNKDSMIDMTIKMAFEKICNYDDKVPKALVEYLDDIYKREVKTLQEDETAQRLDKVIQVFRYLSNKDVFETFYTASLSRRLLDSAIINEDAERLLLMKLKEECGWSFTQRLEVMYKDIKLSEELTKDYHNW